MSTGIEALAERPVVPAVIIRESYTSGCHAYAGVEPVSWEQGGRGGFSRACMHPLDRCGEMLGPMLATIHNLHYYLFLMQEVRNAPKSLLFAKSLSIKVKLLSAPREYFLSSSGNGRLSALM